MNSRIRRLAIGAGLTIAGSVIGLAMSTAAHADDTQQPGGLLDTAVEVVDQVLPESTAEPDPEPTKKPEPTEQESESEPRGEEPATAEPTDPEPERPTTPVVIDVPPVSVPVDVPPAVVDVPVVDVPPVVADVPPVVIDVPPVVVVVPAPTAPTTAPAPTQPAETIELDAPTETTTEPPTTQPAADPAKAATTVQPADTPPTTIGHAAGTSTLLPGLTPTPATTDQPAPAPECADDPDDHATPDHGRGVVRTITDRRTGKPTADRQPAPLRPCPTPPVHTDQAINTVAGTGHTGHHSELYAATTGDVTWPALQRLQQLRARGDLPASRTEHPEPGPA
ncbi:hypothetical protein [Micromonospora sp. NBRC 107095]|uniref:hypothetical protein n=1 Tax=Micromonospora sp. NBRC 107095 TaxID=3032209 RepID=UPI0024A1C778|nr:hypothetical protein [Micromonospora sp. NBRC 107095]GLZ62902.1 hypothetical protein Misp05_64780 [Micromonospora sp. NBRC 107095]